jgi:hypothetical protein
MARERQQARESNNRLLVLVRDRAGRVGHVAAGSALVDADWDGTLSMLPGVPDEGCLAEFFCDTPGQAERAMDELSEIGDFPFHPRDFAPRWFHPQAGLDALKWLLARRSTRKARARLTDAVCAELALVRDLVRDVLERAIETGSRFYLVELEEGEDPGFAGPSLPVGAGEQDNQPDEARKEGGQ